MHYFGKRYHPPGTAPGTLTRRKQAEGHPVRLCLIDYREGEFERIDDCSLETCAPYLDRDETVTWIHVQGEPSPTLLEDLAQRLELHPLALEDVVNVGQRPKIELYDQQFFVTLMLPRWEKAIARLDQVSLFMGDRFVVSFHSGDDDPFEPVRQRMTVHRGRFQRQGADYLLYALIDTVIDLGFPVLERFGEVVEEVEQELLNRPTRETLARIHQCKRDLLLLRRALWPQREVINMLLRDEHTLIQPETRPYLRDCYDHTVQIMDLLETYRDMAGSMLDVYLSTTSNRLNETMRFLTVISTIFIPLTFIAGVYGMNFGSRDDPSPWAMPELDWYYGYPLVLLIMFAVGSGMLWYFRRRRWI